MRFERRHSVEGKLPLNEGQGVVFVDAVVLTMAERRHLGTLTQALPVIPLLWGRRADHRAPPSLDAVQIDRL